MKIKLLSLLFLFLAAPVAMAQKTEKKAVAQATATTQNYEQLKGNYTSAENPDGVLIYVNGDKLMAKIPQQASMELKHVMQNSYKVEGTDLQLHFIPESKQLILQKEGKRQALVKA